MIELFVLAMVVLVFGALGYYTRIWFALVAVLVTFGIVALIRGVDAFTIFSAAVAVIALFAANRWMMRRAFAQYQAQDRRFQAMYDAENNKPA